MVIFHSYVSLPEGNQHGATQKPPLWVAQVAQVSDPWRSPVAKFFEASTRWRCPWGSLSLSLGVLQISQVFIGFTMVYGRYNELVNGC